MEKAQERTTGLTQSLQHPEDEDGMGKGQTRVGGLTQHQQHPEDEDGMEKGQGLTQSLQHPADHGRPPVHVQLGAVLPGEAAGPWGHTGPGWAPQTPTRPLPTQKGDLGSPRTAPVSRSSSAKGLAVIPIPNGAGKAEGL